MSKINKHPKQKAQIRGVFYKKETINDNYYYHYILPNVYHGDHKSKNMHTANTLDHFNTKVNDYIEKNMDSLGISDSFKINKPIYRDGKYHDIKTPELKCGNITHFKCKSTDSMELIVGLEYLIVCDLYMYNFIEGGGTNNTTCCEKQIFVNNRIIGWTIKIVNHREHNSSL